MEEKRVIRLDIVDDSDTDGNRIQATFYLVNPDEEKIKELKQGVENRFSDNENGIENPFTDSFSAVINFIEDNFQTINVEKRTVLW